MKKSGFQLLDLPSVGVRDALVVKVKQDKQVSHPVVRVTRRAVWLDDAIITASLSILKQQFPQVNGLQPPILGESQHGTTATWVCANRVHKGQPLDMFVNYEVPTFNSVCLRQPSRQT